MFFLINKNTKQFGNTDKFLVSLSHYGSFPLRSVKLTAEHREN